jgi:hypothetical protein
MRITKEGNHWVLNGSVGSLISTYA